jgi:hypothetical protein
MAAMRLSWQKKIKRASKSFALSDLLWQWKDLPIA